MKLTNKQLKQIIKEELSYVLNEMSGGLDVLKSNMDMFEYNLVKGSARNPDSLQGYLEELQNTSGPNALYNEAGFPAVYWNSLANASAIPGYDMSYDVQTGKEALIGFSNIFTPKGLSKAIAIIEYLEEQG